MIKGRYTRMNDEKDKIFNEKGSLLLFRKATEKDIDLMLTLMSSETRQVEN